MQFSHAPSDRDLAERLWPERLDGAYAFGSLQASGALLANGSDAPVEELDPLLGIRAGVLRSLDDRPGWHPEQALTIEDTLLASTVAPAWLAERAICSWLALGAHAILGGVPYRGGVLRHAATPMSALRERFRPKAVSPETAPGPRRQSA